MNLIYFYVYSGNPFSGVNKKIFSQASSLDRIVTKFKLLLIEDSIEQRIIKKKFHIWPLISRFYNIRLIKGLHREYLVKKIFKKTIKISGSDTIIYLRYPLPLFLLPFELPIERNCKIVIECNSIEINEYRLSRSYFFFLREVLLGKKFRRRCNGIIGVTQEITNYQFKRSDDQNKPHITIGNGIDCKSIALREIPFDITHCIHLLFVANIYHWHGLDRLIEGLAAYQGPWTITLHVAGDGAELQNLKRKVVEYNLSDNVIFHGFTTGSALDDLFNTCHIAVGSLGIHRKGLTQTSELKIREYCARGIPWIIACRDPDFPDDFWYIHRIPADESPVNIEEVIEFAKRVYADPNHPQKMREYALEHLDWSVKMKKLKAFLESLVDESPSEA